MPHHMQEARAAARSRDAATRNRRAGQKPVKCPAFFSGKL